MRIIPARAGFTILMAAFTPVRGDHPRSRGVYTVRPVPAPEGVGSSPLARGLPSAGTAATTNPADHPRSRGVYPRFSSILFMAPGSSPLARGLLLGDMRILGGIGIIPARAGFT